MEAPHVTRWLLCFSTAAVAASLAGCGGGGEPGSAVTPPARSGQVWEVQGSEDRTAVPGSIVAFVNGVHVMVVDGDRIFAGMTELTTKSGSGGARTITFPSGLSADLVPAAQGGELRFSSGERVAVRARQGE
jgi:hypothetical protein